MAASLHTEAVTRSVLQKVVLKKFHNIHGKTPVLESPFNKVAGSPATLLKRDSDTSVSLQILRNF